LLSIQERIDRLENTGEIYKILGDFDKAIEAYSHSLRINRKLTEKRREGINRGNMDAFYKLKQIDKTKHHPMEASRYLKNYSR